MNDEGVTPRSAFSKTLRGRCVEEFGEDGAWLLLSFLLYGWRAYYDLAIGLSEVRQPHPDNNRSKPFQVEYQIVRDLQVQSFLYSAAEQFAGLVNAARQHVGGSNRFFESFVSNKKSVGDLISSVSDVTVEELRSMLGPPADQNHVSALVEAENMSKILANWGIDLGSTLRQKSSSGWFDDCQDLIESMNRNIIELQQLVDSPIGKNGVDAPPLREVDNSFRHGFRVLFHEAVPEVRWFELVGRESLPDSHGVDLYLPRKRHVGRSVHFGTVYCSPSRTDQHLEAIGVLALRIGQFACGFVGSKTLGSPELFLVGSRLHLAGSIDPSGSGPAPI